MKNICLHDSYNGSPLNIEYINKLFWKNRLDVFHIHRLNKPKDSLFLSILDTLKYITFTFEAFSVTVLFLKAGNIPNARISARTALSDRLNRAY